MSILSVDLGTSNTVAVLAAHGRAPRVVEVDGAAAMPSAVFAAVDGQLVVGREAQRRARLDPARFEPNPKRRVDDGQLLLGDRVVPVPDAFAAVLGKVGAETVRQLGGARPAEVRLTHPAQWGPVRRDVLLSAARQASLGADVVLVPEPVAAAAHFASFPGYSLAAGQALAVYDLGAGTFDVAVVGATSAGFTVLAEAGLPDLGGLDVDQALLAYLGTQIAHHDPPGWQRLLRPESTADRRAARALREDVRAAKEALSGHPQTDLPLPEPFPDVLVTRVELEGLIRPDLLRSVELLASTVRSAGVPSLAGVYLVGGSSRIPLVAQLIGERLRLLPTNLDQPETAVALGAHHVAREGLSQRTEDLPPAVAADERTAAIASPPRPPARSQPVRPQPPRTAAAGTQVPPPPTAPQPPAGTLPASRPKAANRRKVVSWVIVGLLGAVALWYAGRLFGWLDEPPKSGGETTVSIDNPQKDDGVACSDALTDAEARRATSEDAAALEDNSDLSSGCTYLLGDGVEQLESGSLTVSRRIGMPAGKRTEFHGNTAVLITGESARTCGFAVFTAPDPVDSWLYVEVLLPSDRTGVCDVANNVTEAVFDNLPDA